MHSIFIEKNITRKVLRELRTHYVKNKNKNTDLDLKL